MLNSTLYFSLLSSLTILLALPCHAQVVSAGASSSSFVNSQGAGATSNATVTSPTGSSSSSQTIFTPGATFSGGSSSASGSTNAPPTTSTNVFTSPSSGTNLNTSPLMTPGNNPSQGGLAPGVSSGNMVTTPSPVTPSSPNLTVPTPRIIIPNASIRNPSATFIPLFSSANFVRKDRNMSYRVVGVPSRVFPGLGLRRVSTNR